LLIITTCELLVNFIKQFQPLNFRIKKIFLISFFTINLTFGQSSDYQDLVISADLSKNDFISGGTLMQSREFFIVNIGGLKI
jgi:hypothetical protein